MKHLLLALLVVLVAGPLGAQTPGVLLNPVGEIVFVSVDHAKAASYAVGWFKTETQTEPDATVTVPASDLKATGAPDAYTVTVRSRPEFRVYTVRIRMIAAACDPSMCASDWSDPAAWVTDPQVKRFGYTPQRASGFLLK